MSDPSTIDELMSIDPLEMTSEQVDAVIAYHRQNRARAASGEKIAKPKKDSGPKMKLDGIVAGLLGKPQETTQNLTNEPEPPKPTTPGLRRRI